MFSRCMGQANPFGKPLLPKLRKNASSRESAEIEKFC